MRDKRTYRYLAAFLFLSAAAAALFAMNACIGSVGISLPEIVRALRRAGEERRCVFCGISGFQEPPRP